MVIEMEKGKEWVTPLEDSESIRLIQEALLKEISEAIKKKEIKVSVNIGNEER